jgi:hypothetical protein
VTDYLNEVKNNYKKDLINYVYIDSNEFPFEYDVFITDKIV